MTDNESSDMHDDDEIYEAEIVEDDDHAADEAADEVVEIDEVADEADGDTADEPADEGHVDALAALAGGGPATGADALEAMAAGDDAPIDAIAVAEARESGDVGDALASLASGENMGSDRADDEAPDADDPAEAFAFAADEHIHVDPARIREVRKQQNRRAAAVHSTSFKKTMIPMLLVVGVLLLGIGVITGAMKGDPKAPSATMMDRYGTPMMAASLLLGLVLVAGAVLFHLDVRRTQEQEAQTRDRRASEPESDESDE